MTIRTIACRTLVEAIASEGWGALLRGEVDVLVIEGMREPDAETFALMKQAGVHLTRDIDYFYDILTMGPLGDRRPRTNPFLGGH